MSISPVEELTMTMLSGRKRDLNRPWERVLHMARRYAYPGHSVVTFAGEMNRDFFYLAKGRFCLHTFSSSGRERSTLFFEEGCLFNLATVFLNFPEDKWYCLEDSVIWRFSGSLLRDEAFVREYPDLVINLMGSLCFNILSQYAWLTDMYLAPPLARFCRYLMGLHVVSGGKLEFEPGVTQQEAAAELGMHRATLAEAVKELRELGVIGRFTRKRLTILDVNRLKKLAES